MKEAKIFLVLISVLFGIFWFVFSFDSPKAEKKEEITARYLLEVEKNVFVKCIHGYGDIFSECEDGWNYPVNNIYRWKYLP